MKSYSDDMPNITREEFLRAQEKTQEAIDLTKANLAASEDILAQTKVANKRAMVTNIILGLTFTLSLVTAVIQASAFLG